MKKQIECTGNNGFIKGHRFDVISETDTAWFVQWIGGDKTKMTLDKNKRFYKEVK